MSEFATQVTCDLVVFYGIQNVETYKSNTFQEHSKLVMVPLKPPMSFNICSDKKFSKIYMFHK